MADQWVTVKVVALFQLAALEQLRCGLVLILARVAVDRERNEVGPRRIQASGQLELGFESRKAAPWLEIGTAVAFGVTDARKAMLIERSKVRLNLSVVDAIRIGLPEHEFTILVDVRDRLVGFRPRHSARGPCQGRRSQHRYPAPDDKHDQNHTGGTAVRHPGADGGRR